LCINYKPILIKSEKINYIFEYFSLRRIVKLFGGKINFNKEVVLKSRGKRVSRKKIPSNKNVKESEPKKKTTRGGKK
jgi:hypothetical protein